MELALFHFSKIKERKIEFGGLQGKEWLMLVFKLLDFFLKIIKINRSKFFEILLILGSKLDIFYLSASFFHQNKIYIYKDVHISK